MSAPLGGGDIRMEAMQRHLDSVFIGYRPGDPTAGMPPATMPPPSVPPPAALKDIDLREMSMAQLSAEAAATQTRDMFVGLLPDPPGVPPNRIAYITGQAPKEPEAAQQDAVQAAAQQQQQQQQQQQAAAPPRPSQQLSEAEIVAVLQRYLEPRLGTGGEARVGIRAAASSQQPIPWEELGLARGGPRMGGIECDLRRLWRLAYLDQGGFDALGAAGGWPAVAQKLGADLKRITNAGYLVQQWYRRFLLPFERHLEQQSNGGGKKAAAAAVEDGGDADMEDAGPAVADGLR